MSVLDKRVLYVLWSAVAGLEAQFVGRIRFSTEYQRRATLIDGTLTREEI
uniref:PadR family transcriptional regulator n=1 Tax=Ascaris lumbricoides TaxID=6252 RepID=A0A0M3IU16_ASCLU